MVENLDELEEFEIFELTEKQIVCNNVEQMKNIYNLLNKDENIILSDKERSALMIGENISAKIQNGEILISAKVLI